MLVRHLRGSLECGKKETTIFRGKWMNLAVFLFWSATMELLCKVKYRLTPMGPWQGQRCMLWDIEACKDKVRSGFITQILRVYHGR